MSEVTLNFALGVDQVSAETSLPHNTKTGQRAARRLVNVDVTNQGTLHVRSGTTELLTGSDIHSLWAPDNASTGYFVDGTTLYQLVNGAKTSVVTGLTPGFSVSYTELVGSIYWSNGIQSGVITNGVNAAWAPSTTTGPLDQTYMAQVKGNIIRKYRGRIYAVDGRTVWATEPMDYTRVDLMRGFMQFESEVLLFEPVSSGIFIGTSDGVRFLSGPDFKQFQLVNADSLAPVRGSGLSIDGAVFDSMGQGAVWFTERGWVFGAGDGSTKRLTDTKLALPDYESAATLLREHEGMRQLMAFAKGGRTGASATDTVTTEVIRNGVLLV